MTSNYNSGVLKFYSIKLGKPSQLLRSELLIKLEFFNRQSEDSVFHVLFNSLLSTSVMNTSSRS